MKGSRQASGLEDSDPTHWVMLGLLSLADQVVDRLVEQGPRPDAAGDTEVDDVLFACLGALSLSDALRVEAEVGFPERDEAAQASVTTATGRPISLREVLK